MKRVGTWELLTLHEGRICVLKLFFKQPQKLPMTKVKSVFSKIEGCGPTTLAMFVLRSAINEKNHILLHLPNRQLIIQSPECVQYVHS